MTEIYNWQVSNKRNGNYRVISSKYLYACNKVSSLDNFFYFAKGGHFGFLVKSGFFSKKPTVKIGYFALRKKERKKTRMGKAGKSCHQVTWAQRTWQKRERERELELIFDFKIFKCEQLSCINLVLLCAVSSGICRNQLFRLYQNHIYEVLMKFMSLACLMSLAPKYFIVWSKDELKLKIFFPQLLLYG